MLVKSLMKSAYQSQIMNKELLLSSEPAIYVGNHTSLLDAPLLTTYLPKNVVFIVKTDAYQKYKSLLKGKEIVTITPSNPYSVRTLLNILKEGKSIFIFPEGRITLTNNLMKMYTGVAYLAQKTGLDVIPIAINGAIKAKPFTYIQDKIPTEYFPKVTLHVGLPFKILVDKNLSAKENKQKGTDFLYKQMQNLLLESRLPQSVNLVELLRQKVKKSPDFVIAEEFNISPKGKDSTVYSKFTMKDLWLRILCMESVLRSQCTGDRVGILLPNSVNTVSTIYAVMKLDKSPAMLNFSMDASSLSSCLETASINTVITSKRFVEKVKLETFVEKHSTNVNFIYLEEMAELITSAVKLKAVLLSNKKVEGYGKDIILFTSGSEGLPKGVLLSHSNIFTNLNQALLMLDLTSKDKILLSLPMFHSFGFLLTFLTTLSVIPVFLMPSPLAYKEIPEVVYEKRVTVIAGTSTFLNGYGKSAHPYDFNSIRYVVSGAEKCQEHVKSLYAEKFGLRLLEGYGLTETTLLLSLQTPMYWKKNTVGKLIPGLEYKLEKVEGLEYGGQLHVKGSNISKGYLIHGKGYVANPEWFDTGDIVSIDEEGYVSIQGRAKLFVKIAGEMVSLVAVENYVKKALGVENVVAVGFSDEKRGERIELVLFEEGYELQQIKEYWKNNGITPLSLPENIHYMKEMPLLGVGKIDRIKIKKSLESNDR